MFRYCYNQQRQNPFVTSQLIGADKQEENKKIQEYGKKIILMKNFEHPPSFLFDYTAQK
jgi:hypothetical protein